MSKVCKDVGWDGQNYYCMRCGKSGFQSEAQARGHLSQCVGRAVSKGIFVPVAQNDSLRSGCCEQLLPLPQAGGVGGAYVSHLGGAGDAGGQVAFPDLQPPYWSDLDSRVKRLENEYNHLLLDRNIPQQDWFGGLLNNKSIWILGLILVFAFLIDRAGRCPVGINVSNGTKGGIGNIGDKVLNRITDKALTKSIDSIFG